MQFPTFNSNKFFKTVTHLALAFMVCWGLLLVVVQLKPFWVDEWRIIYNLKFKDAAGLRGELDFMQQFPRTYLEVVKWFAALCDYSYFSLRLPSFVVATGAILLAYRLANTLYPKNDPMRFLFVLIIVSSPTFASYFVQVKQYTMDILLSLVAIWQMVQLQHLGTGGDLPPWRFLLLCASLAIAPFFSYTYPIVIAPLYILAVLHFVSGYRITGHATLRPAQLFRLGLPLLISAAGVIAFYITDAAQLMKDCKMHLYWNYLMMQDGFSPVLFFASFYNLFALMGSGLLFEILFGIVGITGFFLAVRRSFTGRRKGKWDLTNYTNAYTALMVLIVMMLYIAGKLPVGEARLNSFFVPVVALLMIGLLRSSDVSARASRALKVLSLTLFIGAAGSIFSAPLVEFGSDKYKKTLVIYENSEAAIRLADSKHIPLFITSEVAYPYSKIINYPCTKIAARGLCIPPDSSAERCARFVENMPGDWVLKTLPAYKVNRSVRVYAINDTSELLQCLQQLPAGVGSVIVGDGTSFREVLR